MKIKTSELTGTALDWAVAKCEEQRTCVWATLRPAPYSSEWSLGGPIIEREKLNIYFEDKKLVWAAAIWEPTFGGGRLIASSKDCLTPLIAAMRCYVASKLGDEVEIPEELI